MTLPEAITDILSTTASPITPQKIREAIKSRHPQFYGTPAQIRNVESGNYKDIDHALLAYIYRAVRTHKHFVCDDSSKPMKVSLQAREAAQASGKTGTVHQRERRTSIFSSVALKEKTADILTNSEKYHEAYYEAETFRGPSLYFHRRALETRNSFRSVAHLEYVYATLASWGMHRMGKGGSKMQSFDVFSRSVEALGDKLSEAQTFALQEMNDGKWRLLSDIFRNLAVMSSGTSLVGNSKVMHHILPNIVPPIDREYTLWFLVGNKSIKNDLDGEWKLMKDIISDFFIPVATNREFEVTALRWISRTDQYPWDTSILKIVDNLVIGSKKAMS